MSMEFEVITDLTPVTETRIDTNFAAIKAGLEEQLAPYATMVVSPEAIGDAKKTRAEIRKVGDSIDSLRKAVKKQWLKPYEEFEAQCKELTGIVNGAVSNIDGQIKTMENEVKEQKRQELLDFFTETSSDIADYITFEDVFDLRMLNSTFALKDAMGEIQRQFTLGDGQQRGEESPRFGEGVVRLQRFFQLRCVQTGDDICHAFRQGFRTGRHRYQQYTQYHHSDKDMICVSSVCMTGRERAMSITRPASSTLRARPSSPASRQVWAAKSISRLIPPIFTNWLT